MARALVLASAEEERLKKRENIIRRMNRDLSMPMLLPEASFKESFRLSKANFATLCEDLIPLLTTGKRNTAVPPDLKILAALQLYASGGYQGNVGNHHCLNLSQATMSKCLMEVTDSLNSPHILRKYINFPRSQTEREDVSRKFMDKFGFPGVLGCIDGTHCAIIRPKDNEEVYFNRKHYHSLNVMMVCDADLQIQHVDASFGGASHDSHVWNSSQLKELMVHFHDEEQYYWLMGDSGYAQRPWLMTPILGAGQGTPEEHYTNQHAKTRNVIERCFGVLKTRFRCLLVHRVMHYDPVKAAKMVNACVVLHNLINDSRITIDQEALLTDSRLQPPQNNEAHEGMQAHEGRQAIVERLWRSRFI